MTCVKIKNSVTVLTIILLLIGCEKQKEHSIERQEVKKPLVFNAQFQTFKNIQLAYNEKNMQVDSDVWANHINDSIVYFNIDLENLKKEPLILKTKLVSTKIPFLLKYHKGKGNSVILEIVQQFNTVYSDSIIFNVNKNVDIIGVDQAFRIGYQHNGTDEICQLKVNHHQDTIDISHQKNISCIERKR